MAENAEFLDFLLERFQIERQKFDRSGVYAYTQRLVAYNSNKIEGSTLTEEQTASLFDNGTLPRSDDYYRAKDVEEMNGHFLMFNKMLDTLDKTLSEDLIKRFHYELKSGVFEDRANGYPIGDYKKRPNIIGIYPTVRPADVPEEMGKLLSWYFDRLGRVSCIRAAMDLKDDAEVADTVDLDSLGSKNVKMCREEASGEILRVLAEFHARYEAIHPFQDGNGRTGRMILFRECLRNRICPVVIEDANRDVYLDALRIYREESDITKLTELFAAEQIFYYESASYFL